MKKMGYDAHNPISLGGGHGILIPLEPTLTKSQLEDWKLHHHIDKSSCGVGYGPETLLRQLTQRLQSHFANKPQHLVLMKISISLDISLMSHPSRIQEVHQIGKISPMMKRNCPMTQTCGFLTQKNHCL